MKNKGENNWAIIILNGQCVQVICKETSNSCTGCKDYIYTNIDCINCNNCKDS